MLGERGDEGQSQSIIIIIIIIIIMKQNWNQFLLAVKATAPLQNSKYRNFIRKFNTQLAITVMPVRGLP